MKFVRFRHPSGPALSGVVGSDDLIFALDSSASISELIAGGGTGLRDAGKNALRQQKEAMPYGEVQLLCPLDTPPTVRDFYAFEGHVRAGRSWRGLEMEPQWYEAPVFYFSSPYAVRGPGEMPMAPGSKQFDFELEIAAVLGGGGSDLTVSEAEDLVAGYCVMNDWSARDLQQAEMKLSMGPVKGKDTATSIGPVFVTKDEIEDRRSGTGYELAMTCRVNGVSYTESSWSDVYWSFAEMVAYASRGAEVRANDIVGSGTANGGCILELSRGEDGHRFPWLTAGDQVEAEVELLGTLHNTLVEANPIIPLRA